MHVAAAAVLDAQGAVLVARRPARVHQGDLWEFPGGKLEPGEDSQAGLARELDEELGIRPERLRPLIRIHHDYPDKSVLLDVWRVDAFRGVPHGREGQPIRWVRPEALDPAEFPAANRPIISALQLPDRYLITPEPTGDVDAFLRRLDALMAAGLGLVQLRAKSLDRESYRALAQRVLELARSRGASVLLNADPRWCEGLEPDGLHLTAARLRGLRDRAGLPGRWLGASCHDEAELVQARAVGVDFVVIGPVRATQTHPGASPLGWASFAALCAQASLPAYALGGVGSEDIGRAQAAGGQGIAAIRALWGAG